MFETAEVIQCNYVFILHRCQGTAIYCRISRTNFSYVNVKAVISS